MKTLKTIAILGSGYLGAHFAKSLKKTSYDFKLSATSVEKKQILEDLGFKTTVFILGEEVQSNFLDTDYLFILTPPSQKIIDGLKNLNLSSETKIIYTSSIGVYDNSLSEFEETLSINTFSERQKLLLDIEKEVSKFPKHLILRLGGIFGEKRNPTTSLSKKDIVPNGETPINLIHLEDILRLFHHLLEHFKSGIYNVVANDHPSREAFYTNECKKLNLTIPKFQAGGNLARIITSSKLEKEFNFQFEKRF